MDEDKRISHDTAESAINAYLEEFKSVIDADGFMAAIWVIVDGRLQLVCCTTHNFPLEDRPIAEQQLREVNRSEAVAAMTPEPLPMADHLRSDMIDFLGNKNAHNCKVHDKKADGSSQCGASGMNPNGEDDPAIPKDVFDDITEEGHDDGDEMDGGLYGEDNDAVSD